jgi:hypothetical protein
MKPADFFAAQAPATTEILGPVNSLPSALEAVAQREVLRYSSDGSSDDVAGDDHLHPAILLTSLLRVIGRDGLRPTEST